MTATTSGPHTDLNFIEAALQNAKQYPSNFDTMPLMMVQDAQRNLDEALRRVQHVREAMKHAGISNIT